MARRVNLYQLIRQIHMYAAFITITFLVMYFVTGYLMNNPQWFDQEKPAPDIKTTSMKKPDVSNEELYNQLKNKLEISGRFHNSWTNKGTTYYEYQSMLRQTIVYFDSTHTTATVKVSDRNTMGSITAYHRLHKYGGPPAYSLYILLMDLASLALLIFVLTGVYMWLSFVKYRWLGVGFLAVGLAYSIWVWLTFIFY
ncbi:MAG: PepSY-associated TM helix domain-containing protein [Imperialibacter sp.]|uniref:PepSY-associated TM helix domain-containing protein n=1 Tax=Imperialibacter sp. TaxID=2038411 RepID=UPI0030D9F6F4